MDGVTLEEWEEANAQAKDNAYSIMIDRGMGFSDFAENALHIQIEEACRILNRGVYMRWKR